ncbi:hypothetical protein [Kitasatospora fiedleri]|uniref:hypothetical protein n=1 Tax=Kitasatospora fiedleri TaxID=2991545 RepID=UPI002499FDC3|nr:hypothetical protein [Kitasatospora fiedleri]
MHMPGRAPGAGGGFHPEPATSTVQEDNVNATTTGRRQAAHIAYCTAPVAAAWIDTNTDEVEFDFFAELEAKERLRFAAEVAALTGTDPQRWLSGPLDGSVAARRLVNQAATAAILTNQAVVPDVLGDDFAELEAEIAAEAAEDRNRQAVELRAIRRNWTRELALAEYTEAQLAAFGDDPMDAWGKDVRDVVETWSPFRADRSGQDPRGRYVIRCKDGSRRYPDGSLAD